MPTGGEAFRQGDAETTIVPLVPGNSDSSSGEVLTEAPDRPDTETETESITSLVLDTSSSTEKLCPGEAAISRCESRARMLSLYGPSFSACAPPLSDPAGDEEAGLPSMVSVPGAAPAPEQRSRCSHLVCFALAVFGLAGKLAHPQLKLHRPAPTPAGGPGVGAQR